MKFARVSIGRLMILIILIAVASAALFRPSRLWAASVFAATFFAITVITLGAIFGRKETRVPFLAFAIGGWLGLLLHFGFLYTSVAGSSSYVDGSTLWTTALLDLLYPRIAEREPEPAPTEIPPPPPVQPAPITPYEFWTSIDRGGIDSPDDVFSAAQGRPQRSPSFLTVGYCIFSLLFATLASFLACWIHASANATHAKVDRDAS